MLANPGVNFYPLPISPERVELSTKFQRLSPHFRQRPIQRTHTQHRPTSGNQYGGCQTGSSCISGTGRDINEILTPTPIFTTTPYSMDLLSTLPDIGRLPKINMAAVKPEVVISQERGDISTKFQRLPPHFRPRPIQWSHFQHCLMSPDFRKSIWRLSNRK